MSVCQNMWRCAGISNTEMHAASKRAAAQEMICGISTTITNPIAAHVVLPFESALKVAGYAIKFIFDIGRLIICTLISSSRNLTSVSETFNSSLLRIRKDIEIILRNIIQVIPLFGYSLAQLYNVAILKITNEKIIQIAKVPTSSKTEVPNPPVASTTPRALPLIQVAKPEVEPVLPYSLVGASTITDRRTGAVIPIEIKGKSNEWKDSGGIVWGKGTFVFTAFLKISETESLILGNIKVSIYKKDTNQILGLDAENKLNRICVETLYSDRKEDYRGVGSALFQAALEYGRLENRNCAECLILDAIGSSHKFYYNLGMRSHRRGANEEIAKLPNHHTGRDFSSYWMYLSEEGKEEWRAKMRAQPIFSETSATFS